MNQVHRVAVLALLAAVSTGCKGSFLAEVQAGYAGAPVSGGLQHAGTLSGHIGGSEAEGFGIGASMRARAMDHGFAFPEVGPHVFVLFEDDNQIAFYTRLNGFVGFGMLEEEFGPVFSAVLNPGILIYPADDPTFLSIGLTGDLTLAPVGSYSRGWLGIQFGYGVGGSHH